MLTTRTTKNTTLDRAPISSHQRTCYQVSLILKGSKRSKNILTFLGEQSNYCVPFLPFLIGSNLIKFAMSSFGRENQHQQGSNSWDEAWQRKG